MSNRIKIHSRAGVCEKACEGIATEALRGGVIPELIDIAREEVSDLERVKASRGLRRHGERKLARIKRALKEIGNEE